MLENQVDGADAEAREGLAGTFARVGAIGFWAQVVLGVVPLVVGGSAFLLSHNISAPSQRFGLIGSLAGASLLILLFTTFWFWRYRATARRLASPQEVVTQKGLLRTVWTGLVASATGIVFSLVVMVFEVGYLLFRFLEAPQGGVPVFQTGADASWISAIDMLGLLALVFTISAEIVALVLGLILLNRTWFATGHWETARREAAAA